MKEIESIAKIIDHTNINSKVKREDILKTCQEAKKYGFRGVCVRLEWVKLVARELKGTGIKTIALIDPPIGDSPHKKRVKMCKKAKKDGADELDVVMSIPDAKHGRWEKILKDLKEICKILPTKVIIGSGYLTDKEIIKASQTVKKAGAICVKTATEKDPLEHRELKEKFYHLKLMRKGAPGLLIKAAGGIRTLQDLKEAIKAGADIVGTSSGVKIMQELKRELKVKKVKVFKL
jgi:deoxyribose-phosphate aldolase